MKPEEVTFNTVNKFNNYLGRLLRQEEESDNFHLTRNGKVFEYRFLDNQDYQFTSSEFQKIGEYWESQGWAVQIHTVGNYDRLFLIFPNQS